MPELIGNGLQISTGQMSQGGCAVARIGGRLAAVTRAAKLWVRYPGCSGSTWRLVNTYPVFCHRRRRELSVDHHLAPASQPPGPLPRPRPHLRHTTAHTAHRQRDLICRLECLTGKKVTFHPRSEPTAATPSSRPNPAPLRSAGYTSPPTHLPIFEPGTLGRHHHLV